MKCACGDHSERATLLENAVDDGDVGKVRTLLEEGTDHEDYPCEYYWESVAWAARDMNRNRVEIIKLLHRGGALYYNLLQYMFQPKNIKYAKELVSYILEKDRDYKNYIWTVWDIFCHLADSSYQGPLSVEVLELLLHNGMALDDFIGNYCMYNCNEPRTPLQFSIKKDNFHFVSFLLERGANANKRTNRGPSPLYMAVKRENLPIVELLINKGAIVNERSGANECGKTALHKACQYTLNSKIMCLLLKHGARIDIVDNYGESSLIDEEGFFNGLVLQELAKLKFSKEPVPVENWNYIQRHQPAQRYLDQCIDELQNMKDSKIYNNVSIYDVFRERKNAIILTRNEEFVAKINLARETICIYGRVLNKSIENVLKKRNVLQDEEKKLFQIFKDCIPGLVLRKVAYFSCEPKLLE